MAYRFLVNQQTCINCGICMDLCPVHCLDMTRPSGEGELGTANDLLSPIPGDAATRSWMMLGPVQVAQCVGCQVCAQECPTNGGAAGAVVAEVVAAPHVLAQSKTPIRLGNINSYTGSPAYAGENNLNGMNLYFDRVNWTIARRQIALIQEDELFNPQLVKPELGGHFRGLISHPVRQSVQAGPVKTGKINRLGFDIPDDRSEIFLRSR